MNRDPIAPSPVPPNVPEPALAAPSVADPIAGRAAALAAVADAERSGDPHRQAKGLLQLAHQDRLASRFRGAHESAMRAARLFRALGDAVGESGARSTLAHAATCLGRNEEAVESALISVQLADPQASAAHQAMLYNYLGVAYLWSRDFEKADTALVRSIRIAEEAGEQVSAFQPLINQILSEALAAISVRYQTGQLPSLTCMLTHHDRCAALVNHSGASGLFQGGEVIAAATWLLTSALVQAWSGAHEASAALIAQADERLASLSVTTLAHAFERWIGAELAWARGDLRQALAHCNGLVEMAQRLEYEQLACVGQLLRSQIHELLGEPLEALAAMRQLRQREGLIRAESLESRERAVQWHGELRLVEQNVRRLEGHSKRLERLSQEDSLTGLANRRHFEDQLGASLAQRDGAPLSIAFIDVDRFKQVNDQHSHRVGDLVLKAIAGLMREAIRQDDIAARLAGDEFAILFRRADAAEAAYVCARISSAVLLFDWPAFAAGLGVSISIGTATALEGDTVESLLHRGDAAMYQAKRRANAAAGSA